MHRLFVAIRPPPAVRAQILALMGGVPGARWQSDEQLHLTLRFIGEVDRHRAEDAAAALGAVRHPAFTVTLGEIGQFERRGRIDSLWIGARPHDPLKALHDRVGRALARVGIAPDGRAFLPHITLARFGRTGGPIGGVPARTLATAGLAFEVAGFGLYESHLRHEGAIYEMVARYPLAAADEPGPA